jgi:hypothetical protein
MSLSDAVLAALVTRGPWTTRDGPLTGDQVRSVYEWVRTGCLVDMQIAVGFTRSSRLGDRALQLLKASGLVRYDHTEAGWQWVAVSGG